jgi:hypothetical protein
MHTKVPMSLVTAYNSAVVEIHLADGVYSVSPAEKQGASAIPSALGSYAWVITAHNPESKVLADTVNTERHAQLLADVRATGCAHFNAIGRSKDGAWREASVAIVGLGEAAIMGLARKYGQLAVFRIDQEGAQVVWASG